jgi:Flp pilus assembly protein TadD
MTEPKPADPKPDARKTTPPFTVAVYNPALLKKEDLIRGFVARQPLLERLLDDLRREAPGSTPQHHLIIGQRGLGKTTLLRRLAFAVEDDPALAAAWMPLVFPEEQYNVAGLGDFWLNCVDALSDALDRTSDRAASQALDTRVERVPSSGAERSTAALNLLLEEADRLGRRVLLLVDNLDIVLDRLKKDEEWEFRRVISQERRLHFVGASSRVLETLYEYGRAFYDFFQVHELKGFDEQETFSTLCQLAEQAGATEVSRLLREQPGRIKALGVLTGGNPRTLVLLFKVLAQGPEGDVQRDIEQLLDEYTALYKARFEELAPQAQQLVDAMAIHWDPLTAADLTERLSPLSVSQVSAQLKRLEDFGVVEKTPWFGEKKNAYQIAERFFNIWYLMRASRRVRRRLLWLVKFLETWFDREELSARARGFLDRDPEAMGREHYAEMALAYSQAVPDRYLQRNLESAGLHAVLDDGVRRLIDFSDLPPELQDRKDRMQQLRDLRTATSNLERDWDGIDPAEFWRLLGGSPSFSLMEKAKIVEQLPSLPPAGLRDLYGKLRGFEQRLRQAYPDHSADVSRLYDALAGGEIADVYDYENAIAVAKRYDLRWLPYIAIACRVNMSLYREVLSGEEAKMAESTLRAIAMEPGFEPPAWNGLGNLLTYHLSRYEEAEQAFRHAIELDPQFAGAWNNLGNLLRDRLSRYEEAEQAYRRAIELDPQFVLPWDNLGKLLRKDFKRFKEAEQACRRAIELDPRSSRSWNGLGVLLADPLKRYEEAEQAYRRAIELDPQFVLPWDNLGKLLRKHPKRFKEAEQACRRAIELDPRSSRSWNGLGVLLADPLKRYEEAERAFRRATELDPQHPIPWSNLGTSLMERQSFREAAEALLRAFEIDPTREWDLNQFVQAGHRLADSPDELPALLKMAQRAHELVPDNTEIQFLLARILTLTEGWPEASQLLEQLAFNESAFFSEEFFRSAIQTGHLDDAIAILERTGANERWRPLYEALQSARAGTPDYLRTVAPEVRTAATKILRRLAPDLFDTEEPVLDKS